MLFKKNGAYFRFKSKILKSRYRQLYYKWQQNNDDDDALHNLPYHREDSTVLNLKIDRLFSNKTTLIAQILMFITTWFVLGCVQFRVSIYLPLKRSYWSFNSTRTHIEARGKRWKSSASRYRRVSPRPRPGVTRAVACERESYGHFKTNW